MKKEKKNTIHAIPALLLSLTLSAAMLAVSCTQRNCRTAERQAVATAQRDTTMTDTVQTATGSSQKKQQAAAPATSTRRSNVAGKHLSDLTRRTVRKFFSNADSDTLSVGRARLAVPRKAMKSGRVLSITPLRKGELPGLPAGLVNVTGGCDTLLAQTDTVSGYRFLPHGEHFVNHPASIAVPYDSTLIPKGYTAADIHTYYYDEQGIGGTGF